MIRFKVFEVMAQRGFMTRKALAEATDIDENTMGKLVKDEVTRIDKKTLNALCRMLDCQPGDLLEYVPETVGN